MRRHGLASARVGIEMDYLPAGDFASLRQLLPQASFTAAQAMLGPKFRVTKERGVFFPHAAVPQVMATIHPSALLRM